MTSGTRTQLHPGQFQRIAKALADPRRFEILTAIAARDELACRTLVERFPIAQATISHHVKELATAGLVEERQEGQAKFFRIKHEVLAAWLGEVRSRLSAD
jgi:ArsR family transcriptional regulator